MSARRTSTWIAALATTLVSLASLAAGAPAGQAVFTVPSFDPGADLRLRQVFIGNVGLNDKSPGWPQWSELMIYQWPLESRVGEATNLSRLNLGWAIQAHPTTLVTFDYHGL